MAVNSSVLTKHDLEELLRPRLDTGDTQILDVSVRNLTKPGDNVGSTMLAVDVILTPGPRTLHLVAKMLPRSIAIQDMFQCNVTVRKEIDLYLLVSPAFERIQKENNVSDNKYLDVFAECYAARFSSKGDSGPVDDGSVILQENLKIKGYECGERFNGLDLAHCKLVIDKLARFHATAVSIKIKKPEEFKETVLKAGATVVVGPTDLNFVKPLETVPEYELMKERISTALLKSKEVFGNRSPKPPREPFATLAHLDLWVNNVMFQYGSCSSRENPTKLKLVDFQITRYDSPARDLLFFLYTSASLEVLSEHYDSLVRLYFDSFTDCLQILGCDTALFTFEGFLKEMEESSVIEFWHLVFMIVAISVPLEDAHNADGKGRSQIRVGSTFAGRIGKLISDFASRNWI